MEKKISITIDHQVYTYESYKNLREIAADFAPAGEGDIIAARVNGRLAELTNIPADGSSISWVTTGESTGVRIYGRTALMIMLKAFRDVLGEAAPARITVQYSLDKGFYCEMEDVSAVSGEILDRVKTRMRQISQAARPILKKTMPMREAAEIYRRQGYKDKAALYNYMRSALVNIYELDGMHDYFFGYMAPDTSYVRYFELVAYKKGFVLQLPDKHHPHELHSLVPTEKLYSVLEAGTRWGELMGISNAADLNAAIAEGRFYELVLVQEALQEKWIAQIAENIRREKKRIVLIAGPSSSGKTSFSHRLSVQLRAEGLIPHPIPVDNYFVNRSETPRDADGKLDYECLGALDTARFNSDMAALLAGEDVELPVYNFITGEREYHGHHMQIGPEDVLVIEGIHALNDAMTYSLPAQDKYKIYISSLTILNIDAHNRISTTDARLLRRMCRDSRTRGAGAAKTIGMWDSVRRGEDANIFPYQEQCDAMFNSVLIYELAILKQYAEPLLFTVTPDQPEYEEANRLLKFLGYFLGVSSEEVPHNSIVREFIGGSIFDVG